MAGAVPSRARPCPPSLRAHPHSHVSVQEYAGTCSGLTALNAVSPQAGMIIDNGVKTTEASAKDKRPFLSVISAR